MNKLLLDYPNYLKPVYLVLLLCTLLLFFPAAAQEKKPSKSKISKTSNKRIIYGLVSFYHNKFNGRRTASGEIFSQSKFTCACNMLPLGTWVEFTNLRNGRTVIAKVNDRLHPRMRRVADLSKAAALRLGYLSWGITRVKAEVLGKKKPQ
ncbi:MAG: septal ring lytic transglycosylase RlpA family protein [Ferruginibacter sp.]